MNKLEAIKHIRTWLRPSNPVITVTDEGLYQHTCKHQPTAVKFAEAVLLLFGDIISQETTTESIVTLAKLPSSTVSLITPGSWGGSKLGSPRRKKEGGAVHKLDIRLPGKHVDLLKLLVGKSGSDKSKVVRRLIEEAAEHEGLT